MRNKLKVCPDCFRVYEQDRNNLNRKLASGFCPACGAYMKDGKMVIVGCSSCEYMIGERSKECQRCSNYDEWKPDSSN